MGRFGEEDERPERISVPDWQMDIPEMTAAQLAANRRRLRKLLSQVKRSGQELAGTCEPGEGGSAPDPRTDEGEPAPNVDSISRVATTGVNREEGSPLLTTQTEEP